MSADKRDQFNVKQLSLFQASDEAQGKPTRKFSDYIVYVDESGDHSLASIDEKYPVFVLALCVFHKRYYACEAVTAIEQFKFRHFGHDLVVLHETDIRKERGVFRFVGKPQKQEFMEELHALVDGMRFILITAVIDKRQMKESVANPYHLALGFCLETLADLMAEKDQHEALTHIVVEARGAKEDKDLELEFRRYCASDRATKLPPFELIFADKRTNSSGLQLADLVARPIGLSVLRPTQPNRAFDVLRQKFFCKGGRKNTGKVYRGLGLKIYPDTDSEKPR